ncbi:MAG: hypothetical protein MMC33_006341 [Icmadophila ericetorum]|nr:hypothetical protein [Icmadophila ericetorum]
MSPIVMATIHEKPTFVLVHGAWHTPQTYSLLQANLKSHDYPSIAVALPSAITAVNQKAVEDFQPDVHAIRTAVISLLAEGKEVVAVMHSYAGIVGGQALEGLGVRQRKERGEKGGVVRLVFVMAYLVPEGFSVRGEAGDETRGERWVVDEEACFILIHYWHKTAED